MNKEQIANELHCSEVELFHDNIAIDGLAYTIMNVLNDIVGQELIATDITTYESGNALEHKVILDNGLKIYLIDCNEFYGYDSYTIKVANMY